MRELITRRCPQFGGNFFLVVSTFFLLLIASGHAFTSPTDTSEIARLQSLLDSCQAYLRRLEDDTELNRLQNNLKAAEATAEMAEREADVAKSFQHDIDARLELERATADVHKASELLSNYQVRRALSRHEIPGVKKECDSLRARLDAARSTPNVVSRPMPQQDGWGIQEGRTWSDAVSETPGEDQKQRRLVFDERSRRQTDRDKPDGAGQNDDPRDPSPSRPGPNRTDLAPSAGPYHEFAALCRIGWASALARYSIGRADDSIIDHLRFAGEHMEMANRNTFDPIRAWPNWRGGKGQLHDQAMRLDRSDGATRTQLANELQLNWPGYADELAKQVVASRLEHMPTCDSHYAELGYHLCYGQQAMQIAEVAEREGDPQLMRRSSVDAKGHIQSARQVLKSLPRVKLATGSCVDLSPVERHLASIAIITPLEASVLAANRGFEETLRILGGVGRAAGNCSGDLVGAWIGSSGGGGFIVRYERSGDHYLGRFVRVRPDMDYREGAVYQRLRKIDDHNYAGTWDISMSGRKRTAQIHIKVQGGHLRIDEPDGTGSTYSRVPENLVSQIRLVGNPGMQNYHLRGYSDHDITFKPHECREGSMTSNMGDVLVMAETSPDPRRVGQRYTFTLSLDNRGSTPIQVSSVGAETTVNGRTAGSGKNYFSPQSHSGRGWLTSLAPPGKKTVIYRGTGTADASGIGLWKTTLTFHTNRGDFTVHTSSKVIP